MRMLPRRARDAVRLGLGRHVDHVRLAVGVEVGQRAGGRRSDMRIQCGNVRGASYEATSRLTACRPLALDILSDPPAPVPMASPCAPLARRRRRVLAARCAGRAGAGAARSQGQLPALGDTGVGRLQRRHRAPARRPDHARDPPRPRLPRRPGAARVPAVASGSRWWPRRARAATSRPTLDERFAWEAFLVRDRSVNAFALPGGYVGVHLGLIAITAHPRRAGLGARRTSCRTSRSATSRAASPAAAAAR